MESVAVLGLGYVGQRLAHAACEIGLRVVGYDISPHVVDELDQGRSRIDDISEADVELMHSAGFVATTDETILANAQVKVVCVPTPLVDGSEPDLTAVRRAMAAVARHLRRDDLVVLESTSYPGTTDDVVRPILESSDLRAGTDFHLACSPERIDPGNLAFGVHNTPKVVGGFAPCCTAAASSFYRKVCAQVVEAKSTREAEMAKLLENTYRMVNIALSNEMAMICRRLGIDPWDVIACASTKPFGFHPFYPGPGVGGHCIPVDPIYLAHTARAKGRPFQLIELAQKINGGMPSYVVERAASLLGRHGKRLDGASVLLLGVTYKPNVADQRESPAEPIARLLRMASAKVLFHDPFVQRWSVDREAVPSVTDVRAEVSAADLTILLQDHRGYDLGTIAREAKLLLDTRGRTRHGNGNTETL
jgi:UDP-N-acetyl-D-glucosamine dehydrogenase